MFSTYTISLPIIICLIEGDIIPNHTKELLIAWGVGGVTVLLIPPVICLLLCPALSPDLHSLALSPHVMEPQFGWYKPHPTSEYKRTRA